MPVSERYATEADASTEEQSLPRLRCPLLGGDLDKDVALLEAVLANGELLRLRLETGDRPLCPTTQEPELSKRYDVDAGFESGS